MMTDFCLERDGDWGYLAGQRHVKSDEFTHRLVAQCYYEFKVITVKKPKEIESQ